jgi:hypothetical protein
MYPDDGRSAADREPARETGSRDRWWVEAGSFISAHAGKLILGVLGAVLGAAAVAIFVPMLVNGWNSATTSGPAVVVRVDVEEKFEDVSLPKGVSLSETELAQLSTLSADAQSAWLQANEHGIVAGERSIVLTLRGNRAHLVRVTDVQAITDCGTPPRGTLVRLATGRGGGPLSMQASIDLDEPDEALQTDPDTGEMSSYFPERTITLKQDEEEVLIVQLYAPDERGLMCDVVLGLTVLDRDEEQQQRIPDDGEPFHVMWPEPSGAEAEYEAAYLGGIICAEFVTATPGWETVGPSVCGPGNAAEY